MISFIIIGRNEGWKLTRCLESIQEAVTNNSFPDYEKIYIDSSSTDDSIERAKSFRDVKIYRLTADYNPAIARNLGSQKATGNVLLFIDGDMEINKDFLGVAFNNNGELVYPFISGQFVNYFYNSENKLVRTDIYDKSILDNDGYKPITGGLFIIKREIWESVEGMRNKYKTGEDFDLGLRLTKKGIKLLRKKEVMATHHTTDLRHSDRKWAMMFNKSELYGRSMLYRDHILNRHIYPLIFRNDYSLILLILCLILSITFLRWYFLLLYIMIVAARSLNAAGRDPAKVVSYIIYYTARDIIVMSGIFFFFPRSIFNIVYDEVR